MRSHDLIEYLSMVTNQGGSDLHLSVGAAPTVRISGQLQPLTNEILDIGDIRDLVFGVLKETQRARTGSWISPFRWKTWGASVAMPATWSAASKPPSVLFLR